MLVFGPFHAAPKDGSFVLYNLSSMTELVPTLPGLIVLPPFKVTDDGESQKTFDLWYYNYVFQNPAAYLSLMTILMSLYNKENVYICIDNYSCGIINIINETLMKIIQSRYDIKYSIINTSEDLLYVSKDGCDFASVAGIKQFDEDRKRYVQFMKEQEILKGR